MKININQLPHDIAIEIIRTLFAFVDCHVEHAYGKMRVATSYALKNNYADDEWISDEFTRKELGITFNYHDAWFKAWNELEHENHKPWEQIDRESKEKCYADFNKMIEAKAEEELERILKEAR